MVDKFGMFYRRLLEKPVRKAHFNIRCGDSVSAGRGFVFGPNVFKTQQPSRHCYVWLAISSNWALSSAHLLPLTTACKCHWWSELSAKSQWIIPGSLPSCTPTDPTLPSWNFTTNWSTLICRSAAALPAATTWSHGPLAQWTRLAPSIPWYSTIATVGSLGKKTHHLGKILMRLVSWRIIWKSCWRLALLQKRSGLSLHTTSNVKLWRWCARVWGFPWMLARPSSFRAARNGWSWCRLCGPDRSGGVIRSDAVSVFFVWFGRVKRVPLLKSETGNICFGNATGLSIFVPLMIASFVAVFLAAPMRFAGGFVGRSVIG